jgi:hypothetical protein
VHIPGATLHDVPGGHAPWLVDAEHAARLIATHPGLNPSDNPHRLTFADRSAASLVS